MNTNEDLSTDVGQQITDDDVRRFREDGAICLRGIISPHWIERLRAATERFLESSGSNASVEGDTGRFVGDVNLWPMDDDFRSFVLEGPSHQIARALMKASGVRLFGDQLFVKEPATTTPTPWHQDQPYWPVVGQDVCSTWVPLDPVTIDSSGLEYVAGSHLWGKRYDPTDFGTMSVEMLRESGNDQIPDMDAERDDHTFLSWDMEPGDCLVHNSLTVHGAGGNKTSTRRRRAYATRWFGDEAFFRPGDFWTSEMCRLEAGQPMESPMFPQVPPVHEEMQQLAEMMSALQAKSNTATGGN